MHYTYFEVGFFMFVLGYQKYFLVCCLFAEKLKNTFLKYPVPLNNRVLVLDHILLGTVCDVACLLMLKIVFDIKAVKQ